jgi:Holliday junction resolvase-like predicted endonuclease
VKGPLLEALMEELFAGVEGLSVVKRNARLRAEEIDLIVKNNLGNGFWQIAGSPILVECKNRSGKTGAREISVLVDKLRQSVRTQRRAFWSLRTELRAIPPVMPF